MSGLLFAAQHLVNDTLSALVFALVYAATDNLALAIGVSIGVGLLQILIAYGRGKQIHNLQWLSLFLVVVLGGATIFFDNPRFAMLKPTIAYIAVGLFMMKPGWMARYMPPRALLYGQDITFVFGYIWAVLMFITAAGNLIFVWRGNLGAWTTYVAVFPVVSKLTLFIVQYATLRTLVPRRAANNESDHA